MVTRFPRATLLLILPLIHLGCNSEPEKIDLRLNVSPGDVFTVQEESTGTLTLDSGTETTEVTTLANVRTEMEVEEADANGSCTFIVRIQEFQGEILTTTPQGAISMRDLFGEYNPFTQLARILPGMTFTASVDPYGNLLGVDGLGELQNLIAREIDVPREAFGTRIPERVRREFTDGISSVADSDVWESQFIAIFDALHETPVALGESWGESFRDPGTRALFHRVYTLSNVTDTTATIGVVSEIDGYTDGSTFIEGGTDSGTIELDLQTGFLRRYETTSKAHGSNIDAATDGKPANVSSRGHMVIEVIAR